MNKERPVNKPDTAILSLIKLKYSGEEREAYLKAWSVFPTFVKDCPSERKLKEKLRAERARRILNGEFKEVTL